MHIVFHSLIFSKKEIKETIAKMNQPQESISNIQEIQGGK